ncbi:AMP-binding protein [Streptomyces buecherae]|uniref:AMP-binding protein n=1 Tax=Streptomyces buecherae TaxID=2763006 RepID=UPI001C25C025|nr:AMP-binding protein [Streptomyces buecherae]
MTETHFTSYVELILDSLRERPERTVLRTEDGASISAGALCDAVHGMAAELTDRGIGRGDTVALLSGNRPETLTARYAVNLVGARVVILYEALAAEMLARLAASVEPAALLVDPRHDALAAELLTHHRPPLVLSFGPSEVGADLLALAEGHRGRRVPSAARAEDDWCIRHTGGTTGLPKGIRMAHGFHRQALSSGTAASGHAPTFLACTSLAHLAGMVADLALLSGGRVIIQRSFDPAAVYAAIERERVTDLWLLPPLLYALLDHPARATADLSSVRRIAYGGCAASPSRLREAAEAFGPVLNGWYGQAEAGMIATVGPAEHAVVGAAGQITVGRPAPGVRIEIHDEHGQPLAAGESGEICVRTPSMMNGYWKQPEATAEVLRDGWVHTGDMGYLDEDGYLFIVDRLSDKIVVVGGHVYPTDVEELLLSHPSVAACVVFGVRRPDQTEAVHAAVVPAPGHSVRPQELRSFVTDHRGAMYAPEVVRIVAEIPLTQAGKPDRKALRALALADADADAMSQSGPDSDSDPVSGPGSAAGAGDGAGAEPGVAGLGAGAGQR